MGSDADLAAAIGDQPTATIGQAPPSDERTPSRKPESFFSPPRVRLATLLAWMLIAGGVAGWAKYHLDIAAEERAVLQELADVGCRVEAVRSYRPAYVDGHYGTRFWYEPPFLERVRELKMEWGEPSTGLLIRAASLPEVERFAWSGRFRRRESPVDQVAGRPTKLPAKEILGERDLVPQESQGTPLSDGETRRVLAAVREAWSRSPSLPQRLSALRVGTTVRTTQGVEDRTSERVLFVSDGAKMLFQDGARGPIAFVAERSKFVVDFDQDGRWRPLERDRVETLEPEEIDARAKEFLIWTNPLRYADLRTLEKASAIGRLDEDRYRIEFVPLVGVIYRDGEAADWMTESVVIVSERDEWLPLAVRRVESERFADRTTIESKAEAFRYEAVEDRRMLAERLTVQEFPSGYRQEDRLSFAWDFDPTFDETTFDPRRLVGPEWKEPGTYPFRWYWIPFVAGVFCQGCLVVRRILDRRRSQG